MEREGRRGRARKEERSGRQRRRGKKIKGEEEEERECGVGPTYLRPSRERFGPVKGPRREKTSSSVYNIINRQTGVLSVGHLYPCFMPGQRGKANGGKKTRQDNGGPRSDPLAGSWLKDDRQKHDEHSAREKLPIEMIGITKITFYNFAPSSCFSNLE